MHSDLETANDNRSEKARLYQDGNDAEGAIVEGELALWRGPCTKIRKGPIRSNGVLQLPAG